MTVLDGGKPKVSVAQETWNTHGPDGKVQNTEAQNSIQALAQVRQTGGVALPDTEKTLDLSGVF